MNLLIIGSHGMTTAVCDSIISLQDASIQRIAWMRSGRMRNLKQCVATKDIDLVIDTNSAVSIRIEEALPCHCVSVLEILNEDENISPQKWELAKGWASSRRWQRHLAHLQEREQLELKRVARNTFHPLRREPPIFCEDEAA